jgi:hypothetical protein
VPEYVHHTFCTPAKMTSYRFGQMVYFQKMLFRKCCISKKWSIFGKWVWFFAHIFLGGVKKKKTTKKQQKNQKKKKKQ